MTKTSPLRGKPGGSRGRSRRYTARLEDIRNRFGERVARIVEACSDSLADTGKGERKAHWQERKETYIAHLLKAKGMKTF